jgi:hypothetical protein
LPEGLPKNHELADGMVQAVTSFRSPGYGGPCPPFGTHRYVFEIFALDTHLNLIPQQTTHKILKQFIKGHILARAQLTGLYSRDSTQKMNWR